MYCISRAPSGGIGDHLICFLASWWYAKQTNRTLVVDWRSSRFNPEPGHNCFLDFFEPLSEISGVPIIADGRVVEITPEPPYYWSKWTAKLLKGYQHVPHTSEEINAMKSLVLSGLDRPESAVIFNQHFYLPLDRIDLSPAISKLKFVAPIRESADRFCSQFKTSNPDLIAVHIRHGNGENIGQRSAYWLDFIDWSKQLFLNSHNDMHSRVVSGRFFDNMPETLMNEKKNTRAERRLYRVIASKIKEIRSNSEKETPVILFTDASQVVEGLSSQIKNIYCFDTELLDQNSGPIHNFKKQDGKRIDNSKIKKRTNEMLVELEIMRRCSHLIFIESGFSILLQIKLSANRLFELKPPFLNRLLLKLFS